MKCVTEEVIHETPANQWLQSVHFYGSGNLGFTEKFAKNLINKRAKGNYVISSNRNPGFGYTHDPSLLDTLQ